MQMLRDINTWRGQSSREGVMLCNTLAQGGPASGISPATFVDGLLQPAASRRNVAEAQHHQSYENIRLVITEFQWSGANIAVAIPIVDGPAVMEMPVITNPAVVDPAALPAAKASVQPPLPVTNS
jgi:hypothetical protein